MHILPPSWSTWRRRAGAAALSLAGGLASLTGCGGSGGGASAPPSVPDGAVTGLPAPSLAVSAIKRLDIAWPAQPGATAIRVLVDPDAEGAAPEVVLASLPGDATGHAMDVFLPLALQAAYRLERCDGAVCRHSLVARLTGSLAQAVGYLKPIDPTEDGRSGSAVALSADGQTHAVGSAGRNDRTGEVIVYRRDGLGAWVIEQVLQAPNAETGDRFGAAVALSADGNLLAVGADSEDGSASSDGLANSNNDVNGAGAVYLFERQQGVWSFSAHLKPTAVAEFDFFGAQLELSGDGQVLVATSGLAPPGDGREVHVFDRLAGPWAERSVLRPGALAAGDRFGDAIALSQDGRTLAVGDPWDDSAATGVLSAVATDEGSVDSGAVHVYVAGAGGWTLQVFVKAGSGQAGASFGDGVDLSADGHTLVVGASGDQVNRQGVMDPGLSNAGAAFVFHRSGSDWSPMGRLALPEPRTDDLFGEAVAVSGDGLTVAVGATGEDGADRGIDPADRTATRRNTGVVQVYRRTAGAWGAGVRVKPSHAPASAATEFGAAVALSGDGRTLAVGAPGESGAGSGVAADPTVAPAGPLAGGASYLY